MAQDSRRPVDDLEALAQARFGELSEAELKLLRAAPNGGVALCGPSAQDDDPANDPAKADEWGPEREIRAELIRWLCKDCDAANAVDPGGIQIHGAKISGGLDLSFVSVPFPLRTKQCRFTENASLISTQLPALNLGGSRVLSVVADRTEVKGNVFLRDGFRAEGAVRLLGAQIGGDLDCSGGTFSNPGRDALRADGAGVKGGVYLNDGFSAEGDVGLVGAQIGVNLDCSGGTFKNPDKDALSADGANVKGDVHLSDGFTAEGDVRLLGAQIGGNLDCSSGTFKNPGKRALSADGANVRGDVSLKGGFSAEGEVRLLGAQIGGSLDCSGSAFTSPRKNALNADRASVKGSVFFNDGFNAEGEVRLVGAQFGCDLSCGGGTFKNPGKQALSFHNARVEGSIYLRSGFTADGAVGLLYAQIGGTLDCTASTFKNPGKEALSAHGANVRGDVSLSAGFSAEGEVRLHGAQIDGDLNCIGGTFKNPGKHALTADGANVKGCVFLRDGFSAEGEVRLPGTKIGGELDCSGGMFSEINAESARIVASLQWRGVKAAKTATLNLTNASAGSLVDEKDSWPSRRNLFIDGFAYGYISGDSPRDAKTRLEWLDLQDPFVPKPYRQLAKVLREEGRDSDASKVLFEMEGRRRKDEDRRRREEIEKRQLPPLYFKRFRALAILASRINSHLRSRCARLWDWALKWTVGYGFYSWWALGWLVLLTALGWGLFRYGYSSGAVTPTDTRAYHFFRDHGWSPDHYQRFTASVYSLENSLPFVNLGQKDNWTPDPNPQPSRWMPGILRWFRWVQVLLGWLLATLFVAGVTRVVRKE
jgi:hypothetical protein